MARRVALDVEVPGLRIEFRGSAAIYETMLRDVVAPIAGGTWRTSGPALATLLAPAPAAAAPVSAVESPAAAAAFRPAPAPAVPASFSREPSPRGAAPGRPAAEFDPAPLFARLAAEEGRRAEKDAVLLALVSLAASGRKDATPAEITAHMEAHGFPVEGLKPRPILAKLSHRKGLAAPGVLPNTFRATPAGAAYVWKRTSAR